MHLHMGHNAWGTPSETSLRAAFCAPLLCVHWDPDMHAIRLLTSEGRL